MPVAEYAKVRMSACDSQLVIGSLSLIANWLPLNLKGEEHSLSKLCNHHIRVGPPGCVHEILDDAVRVSFD